MPHATDLEESSSGHVPPTLNEAERTTDLSPADAGPVSPRDVKAQLHYLSPSVEYSKSKPPIQIVTRSSTTRDPRTTVRIAQGPVETIHDVRGREHEFTLDQNGFRFVRNRCRFQDWESRDGIWNQYVEELKDVVAEEFGGREGGVDEIIAFHEGKRGSNKEWKQAKDGQRTNPFARQVHVDQSEPTIRRIVKEKTDIKGDWLWKGRVRQVNAWRPLYHPVYDCGLCVADATTVRDEDLIEAHRLRESDGTFLDTMGVVKYREGRDWYYKSRMDPDDVVLFMGYDSDCKRGYREGTGFTLHSAFDIPDPPPGSPPRASIEVRLLIFTWPREPLVIPRPLAGMLTTQVPPRSEEVYQTHHTANLEVEEAPHHVVTFPDDDGTDVQIDLNEYDPIESDLLTRRDSRSSASYSPRRRSSSFTRSSSISLEEDVTESQVLAMADQRVVDLKRQIEEMKQLLQGAIKTKAMMQNPENRKRMALLINARRSDEIGRQRLELARRLRCSLSEDVFFDL
ncbi:uncharacterized protein PV09_06143 [Verruconis gallopava]|uniref:Uncharacterized protein n=1 Tax=Verruconis gallopava TaxID=253628 RepID=A0A0D2A7Z3_9PEZI|nr:uncharacterized protein PV09_06143 [Verruconis gallopava]KIW02705.1 hypothetical protein PV09_06143 [Verruconis gallopava]